MHGFIKFGVVYAALMLLSSTAHAAGGKTSWGYEGNQGPANWADLDKGYAACNGNQQSPIDLNSSQAADNENVKLGWQNFTPVVLNNGHTIQANAPKGSNTLFGGKKYSLLQVHFHHRSEHTIAGKYFAMEAHFVHQGDDGSLLVLGVMIKQGKANSEIAKIWAVAPDKKGEAKAKKAVSLSKLVPSKTNYFHYAGSLTTPPCSEIVNWVVFATPVTASKEQIDAFADRFQANNRPVQPLNRRFVLSGK